MAPRPNCCFCTTRAPRPAGSARHLRLAFPPGSDVPHVAFIDVESSFRATVMRFNALGAPAWEPLGARAGAPGSADVLLPAAASCPLPPGLDLARGSSPSSSLSAAAPHPSPLTPPRAPGPAGFTASAVQYTRLAFDAGGAPVVAFKDTGRGGRAGAARFSAAAGAWQAVGPAAFTPGMCACVCEWQACCQIAVRCPLPAPLHASSSLPLAVPPHLPPSRASQLPFPLPLPLFFQGRLTGSTWQWPPTTASGWPSRTGSAAPGPPSCAGASEPRRRKGCGGRPPAPAPLQLRHPLLSSLQACEPMHAINHKINCSEHCAAPALTRRERQRCLRPLGRQTLLLSPASSSFLHRSSVFS